MCVCVCVGVSVGVGVCNNRDVTLGHGANRISVNIQHIYVLLFCIMYNVCLLSACSPVCAHCVCPSVLCDTDEGTC